MMALYARIENNQLLAVSSSPFENAVSIPPGLQDKSLSELIITAKIRDGQLVSKCEPGKRIAFITNWKMRCGIATYANSLYSALLPLLTDYKLFVEYNDNPTSSLYELDGYTLLPDQVLPCWKRGEPLDQLIAEVKAYDPDVVFVNHEFGLFSNARYWLSLITQLHDYRIITTLHSVFPHHYDKTIIEASLPEIIVHLDGAKSALEKKGISGKIIVIPHGCYEAEQSKLWNMYHSQHTFCQLGFGLRYKHFETSIKATSILKKEFSDIFFTGIFSETDFNHIEHSIYYNELIQLINDLDLVNNVALIRGFQNDQVISSYLRTNQTCYLPYGSDPQHEVFGASGAARLAMAHGVPVITSHFHHFDDLPTIKVKDEIEGAKAISNIFNDKVARANQITKQNSHIGKNNWKSIASRYLSLIG